MKALILLFFFSIAAGPSYKDIYGNEFIIETTQALPKEINFEFLKNKVHTKHFIENYTSRSYHYQFTLLNFKKKSNKVYELKVKIRPLEDEVKEILKYANPFFYVLRTKLVDGKLEVESIKFDRGEI